LVSHNLQKPEYCGSLVNNLTQAANILSLIKLMHNKIMEPLILMKKLFNKIFLIPYPEQAL
jgi:hypothetical protein